MSNLIVIFPKLDNAKNIRNLLVRHGYSVAAVCTTGAQVLNYANELSEGIVICGYRFSDMIYTELYDNLPSDFEMLLLASQAILSEYGAKDIISVTMPLKVNDLISTVNMMEYRISRSKKKLKSKPKQRDPKEAATIEQAKRLLMERNHLTEEEAHRYLQKSSMDSATNMVETAQMVLSMMNM
jgi:two-component system, response regulator PdtaR